MTPCPDCTVDLDLFPHQRGVGCFKAWYDAFLVENGALLNAIDGIGPVKPTGAQWPDYASFKIRITAAIGNIRTLKNQNKSYQDIINASLTSNPSELQSRTPASENTTPSYQYPTTPTDDPASKQTHPVEPDSSDEDADDPESDSQKGKM